MPKLPEVPHTANMHIAYGNLKEKNKVLREQVQRLEQEIRVWKENYFELLNREDKTAL